MSYDTQTIERYNFCMELAEELNMTIQISGTHLRLTMLRGDLIGAFQDLDDLYNYLLGHRDGIAAVREAEALDKMSFDYPDYE